MADLQEVKIQSEMSSSSRTTQMQGDQTLEDERATHVPRFLGATLQIDSVTNDGTDTGVTFSGVPPIQSNTVNPNYSLNSDSGINRPDSAVSRQSSTGSKTSRNPQKHISEYWAKGFFSCKESAFENAVEDVRKSLLKLELDGQVTGAWLLTQIDHWDNEKEVIVLLTENSLVVVRYDFVAQKVYEHKRVLLHIIDRVQMGNLKYPEKSLMTPRNHGGVRAWWNKGQEPTFGQKWNPLCTNIPWLTFAHHPMIYSQKEQETITYNVDDFYESFIQAINQCYERKKTGCQCNFIEGDIIIESYCSFGSMIHNQSQLGFSRERGGISF